MYTDTAEPGGSDTDLRSGSYRVQVWRRGKTVLSSLQDTPGQVADYLFAYAAGIGEPTDYVTTQIRAGVQWAASPMGVGNGHIGSSTFTIERTED